MIKLSDYVVKKLIEHGIRHVFMVTGGGAMHLDDSIGKNKNLQYICNHHEQACAMAAESYARLSEKIAAVCVTTGPGGTNAITGVYGAFVDSIPMLIISGQVRYDTTVASTGLPLRQLGDQEIDIIKMVSSITKYSVMVIDPASIRYHLEKAFYLATIGRSGPCWIDIPMDVQGAMIDEKELQGYNPAEDTPEAPPPVQNNVLVEIIDKIKAAKRPVLFAGSAIRSSGAYEDFLQLVKMLNIPVVTAWNAHDVITNDHPLYFGRPGSVGDRAGNFIVQNSDLLLVLGCRLNIRQLSYNWQTFAREAFKIMVDIDSFELKKPTIKPNLPVQANVADVIRGLIKQLPKMLAPNNDWLTWCRIRKQRYPVVQKEYWAKDKPVNPYCFVEKLGRHLPEGQITVTGDGTACVCSFQAMEIKKGQRLYTNSGCAAMGYDLPAAIGACFGSGKQKIICLTGDGSIQMNLQELQTIMQHRLPIKIFILNNDGYNSIKQTQEAFFGKPFIGCNPKSGVSFPSMGKIARAYNLPYIRCSNHQDLDRSIKKTLKSRGAAICEVILDPGQPFAPKSSSMQLPDGRIISKPLEDLAPFLPREEFLKNMIVKPLKK